MIDFADLVEQFKTAFVQFIPAEREWLGEGLEIEHYPATFVVAVRNDNQFAIEALRGVHVAVGTSPDKAAERIYALMEEMEDWYYEHPDEPWAGFDTYSEEEAALFDQVRSMLDG